jgi:hypothetical protein
MRTLGYTLEIQHAAAEPDEQAIASYYQSHAPPGSPPIEIMHGTIKSLLATVGAPDSLTLRASAQRLRELWRARASFSQLGAFVAAEASTWFEAHVVWAGLAAALAAPVGGALACELGSLRELLAEAAAQGRRLRFRECEIESSPEDLLGLLDDCGVRLRAGRSLADLFVRRARDQYHPAPWHLLLNELSELSDDVVAIDHRCIETSDDSDIYACVARSIATLSRGALQFDSLSSEIDFGAEKVAFSFVHRGQRRSPTLAWRGSFLDPSIFTTLAALLDAEGRVLAATTPLLRAGLGTACLYLCLERAAYDRLIEEGAPLEALFRSSAQGRDG